MKPSHENISEELLARYLADTATSEEKATVENWLAQSPDNARELADYKLIWHHAGLAERKFSVDTDGAWNKVQAQMSGAQVRTLHSDSRAKSIRSPRFAIMAAAAAVLLVLAFGWVFLLKMRNPEMITLSTGANTEEKVLPDGSSVFLNYNSSITFPENFEGDIRSVALTGEAFFDIQKDPSHPFIIEANGTQIKVLGTSFNVKAYKGKSVRVDVATGKVNVSKASRQINLEKGQSAEVLSDTIRSLQADMNALGYRTQVYDFNATDLNDVITSIREGYHVDVRLTNREIAKCRLTIRFEKEPVDATLAVIAETMNLDLRKEGKVYWLDGNGCQ